MPEEQAPQGSEGEIVVVGHWLPKGDFSGRTSSTARVFVVEITNTTDVALAETTVRIGPEVRGVVGQIDPSAVGRVRFGPIDPPPQGRIELSATFADGLKKSWTVDARPHQSQRLSD